MTFNGFNLGDAHGRIIISTDGIEDAVAQAQRAFDAGLSQIGDSLQRFGDGVSNIGEGLTVLTAPLLAFGATGLAAAADFDTLMRQIEVFGGVAGADLERVRQFALQMGADTKFSSSDAASALLELLKAGQSLEQAMATLPEVLSLAAAGNLSLERSSGIVSSALAIYKLRAEDAARVSNALAQAANASRADVGDLGDALTNVGPVAAQFGLNVEDTAAILAVFAQNGIMGAEAGTQLRSMLLNMNENTETTQAAWSELGVSLYDSQGNVRDLNTVIRELDAALDRLPVEDQNRLMQALGGAYGIVGLSALRAADGIDEMRAAMDAAPEAGAIASSFMDAFRGRVESLMGSLETLQIEVLTPLMNNTLGPLVDRVTEVVNGLTAWVQANPALAQRIVEVLAVVTALGPGLFGLGKAISAVGALFKGLGSIVALLTSGPLGLLLAAVGALFVAFETNFLGIRDVLEPVIALVSESFGQFFAALEAGVPVGDALRVLLFNLLPPDVAAGLVGAVTTIGESIGGVFETVVNFIQTAVLPALAQLYDWFVTEALPAVIAFVTGTVVPALQQFFNWLGQVWETIRPGLEAVYHWFVTEALPAVVNFVQTVVLPTLQQFFNWLGQVWAVVGPALGQLYDWFVNTALPDVVSFVQTVIIPGIQTFLDFLAGAWEFVRPALEAVYNWFVVEALPAIVSFVEEWVIPGVSAFFDYLETVWTLVGPVLGLVYNWFVTEALPAIHNFVVNTVHPAIQEFIRILQGIWEAVRPGLEPLFNWFNDTFTKIKQFVQDLIDKINELKGGLGAWEGISNNAAVIGQTLASGQVGLGDFFNAVVGAVGAEFRDVGGPGVAGMPYLIGRPQYGNELFVPSTDGMFVPDFARILDALAGSGGRGGGDIYVQMPAAALADPISAQQRGYEFGEAIRERLRFIG